MMGMKFLTRRLLGRLGPAGKIADLAVVGGTALKLAQRKGLISDETASRLGASNSSAGSSVSFGEMAILVMALWRLVRQFTRNEETIIIDVTNQ